MKSFEPDLPLDVRGLMAKDIIHSIIICTPSELSGAEEVLKRLLRMSLTDFIKQCEQSEEFSHWLVELTDLYRTYDKPAGLRELKAKLLSCRFPKATSLKSDLKQHTEDHVFYFAGRFFDGPAREDLELIRIDFTRARNERQQEDMRKWRIELLIMRDVARSLSGIIWLKVKEKLIPALRFWR